MTYFQNLQRILAFFLFSFFLSSAVWAQQGIKTLEALRVATPPKLDGALSDPIWQLAKPAANFLQYEPHNDRPASFESDVRVLFDDNSLYIGAFLFDPRPDSILTELGLRDADDKLNADQFWVDINPFNDGVNGFRFKVSASGVQTDLNLSGGSNGGFGRQGDLNWDAVWKSFVTITDKGWIVEMEIPYSALRFPKGNVQDWGINFWREIRRSRESSSWNFVNRRIGDPVGSLGLLSGMEGIDPPLRLAFFPYVSGYMEKNGSDLGWARSVHGGMDVKYGISESFTLDMTLIPDFGQVHSDARVLNLTPFEVKYDENRQFFTEGTELFSKADLFYSRRIGTEPKGFRNVRNQLEENEIIKENPIETRLINATKFSGRTARGLGIGIFNAMTAASHATLHDTITGETRKITTQPFTNYNLVVLDQSLPNNSFISLINTNVAGSVEGYSANVTGTDFRLRDRTNMFRISGSGAFSQQYYQGLDNNFGHKYELNLGKYGGTWQYSYSRSEISDTYYQNDMGFLRRNNEVEDEISFSYNIFDPFWRILNMSNELNFEYGRLYNPNTFTEMDLGYNFRVLFDSRFFIVFRANLKPRGERDYFEPRAPGRFYETDPSYNLFMMYSSDYRKRVFFDGSFGYTRINSIYDQSLFTFDFRPTFRASDRLNMNYGLNFAQLKNDIGYVAQLNPDTVYFGLRQSPTIINTFRTTYIFSPTIALNFDLRHYWSRVFYDGEYFFLNNKGRLDAIDKNLPIPDINYNAFTIDLKFTWNFAPGSQLSLVWKNIIDSRTSNASQSFIENLERTLNEPQVNSFSLKLLYYIDYQMIRRTLGKH
jgi:hypothetical protein